MFVLSVQIDEIAGDVAQAGTRRQCAVDKGAAASLRGDLAPYDHFPAVARVENAFNRRGIFASAHEICGGTATDEESNGADEDRLSCAGFAGQHGQSWPKL